MATVAKFARVPTSRSSRQIATNDDAVAKQEEVEEQIEEDRVEKAARENRAGDSVPIMRGNQEIESADDAVASREEVEEQAGENRIDKVAFNEGISAASAKEYIGRGRNHD